MSVGLSEKERQLADSILSYGFAAAIEVTNNLTNAQRENRRTNKIEIIDVYGAKAGQASVAKSYLEELVGYGANIAAGLVYNGDPVNPADKGGLDFMIDINGYEPERLERVAREILERRPFSGGKVTNKHRDLIKKMLMSYDKDMPLSDFFSYSKMNLCAERIGEDPIEYGCLLSHIKGICMEHYIRSLFGEALEDRVLYHNYIFEHSNRIGEEKKLHEADEIVVCSEDDFYNTLEDISESGNFESWIKRGVPL